MDDILITLHDSKSEQGGNRIFATKSSIGEKEFYDAHGAGLKLSFKLLVWKWDYAGQSYCEADGALYRIERTYTRADEKTELYLSERIGV